MQSLFLWLVYSFNSSVDIFLAQKLVPPEAYMWEYGIIWKPDQFNCCWLGLENSIFNQSICQYFPFICSSPLIQRRGEITNRSFNLAVIFQWCEWLNRDFWLVCKAKISGCVCRLKVCMRRLERPQRLLWPAWWRRWTCLIQMSGACPRSREPMPATQ